MKILVTGARGFIGKNLCQTLKSLHSRSGNPLAGVAVDILECDVDTPREQLEGWLATCDFVFHLAGVNRPKDPAEFKSGNAAFTEDILEKLGRRAVPVLLASSTQAALDNDYGRSKKAAEDAVFAYGKKTGAPVYVYRFANVFGKWCRPNYNSVVATWCHNMAHDFPIEVRDPHATVTLVYIDDLVDCAVSCLQDSLAPSRSLSDADAVRSVTPAYTKTLGEIVALLKSFHDEPMTLLVPNQSDDFTKKLYATYLSYLPEDGFAYPVEIHCDSRGSFTELFRMAAFGQVSVNVSRPGVTKGEHWHQTKHEKFCVVSGAGRIQFRKMGSASTVEYRVSGEKLEIVRIPPGYVHNIINDGDADLVTVMWANEVFNPSKPDTFAEKVRCGEAKAGMRS